MLYLPKNQEGIYGIMYKHDPRLLPDFKYYQTSDERNEVFKTILETGQVFCEERGHMVAPYKLCMIEKDSLVYHMQVNKQ